MQTKTRNVEYFSFSVHEFSTVKLHLHTLRKQAMFCEKLTWTYAFSQIWAGFGSREAYIYVLSPYSNESYTDTSNQKGFSVPDSWNLNC